MAELDWVNVWGQRLLAGALVYIAVALVLSFSIVSSGLEPPPFLPGFVRDVIVKTYQSWTAVAGRSFNASILQQIIYVYNILVGSMQLVFSVMVATAISYIYLSYVLTMFLPYPLSILSIPAWVGAVLATLVMNIYLIKKIAETINSMIPPGPPPY